MPRITLFMALYGVLNPSLVLSALPGPVAVPQDEALAWTHYLVPLPKQVAITAKLTVPANEVAVKVSGADDPLARQAVKELHDALGRSEDAPSPTQPMFTITLQMGGPDAEKLKDLKNADQAYSILPEADARQLRLVALRRRGLYYAGKTVQQLIKAKVHAGQVEMPLLRVTDWPDLQDRGLWGGDSSNHLRWMSDRKMNYDEQISHTGVDKDKRCYVSYPPYKQRMIDEGPTYGINPVPVVLHLEQLKNSGVFDAYPQLQGKDARKGAICYSNPLFVDILSQWLLLWRAKPGVKEIDVWLAENLQGQKGCQCDECKKEDRNILEVRAVIAAWNKAKLKQPDLGLRVLTSEETEKSNPRILKELPPDVKLWYYHSLFTYNTSHKPMIRPYLLDAIKEGRWVGVCPNISALVGFWTPMSSADFVHARMNEFVDKKLFGLLGYAVPRLYYTFFNTEAAAEWSWNAKGRSPHEFAFSYAVRQGYKNPKLFADWSDALGPVSWDVYGSEWPSGELRGVPKNVAERLRTGTLRELGYVLWDVYASPWGDIKSLQQLDNDVAQADRALEIARQLEVTELIQESLVIQGYIRSLKALWELRAIVKPEGVAPKDRDAARRYFKMYVDSLEQSANALPAWEAALPLRKTDDRPLTGKPVGVINKAAEQMAQFATDLGFDLGK